MKQLKVYAVLSLLMVVSPYSWGGGKRDEAKTFGQIMEYFTVTKSGEHLPVLRSRSDSPNLVQYVDVKTELVIEWSPKQASQKLPEAIVGQKRVGCEVFRYDVSGAYLASSMNLKGEKIPYRKLADKDTSILVPNASLSFVCSAKKEFGVRNDSKDKSQFKLAYLSEAELHQYLAQTSLMQQQTQTSAYLATSSGTENQLVNSSWNGILNEESGAGFKSLNRKIDPIADQVSNQQ